MSYIVYLIFIFRKKVEEQEGFTPEICWPMAERRIESLLHREEEPFSPKEIEEVFEFYLNSKKYKEFGPQISVALSGHTINLWKQKQANEAWQYA